MKKICGIFMLAAIIVMAASCDKEQIGDPYMLFEIHGTVVDTEGNPLKGIHVTSGLSDVQTTNVNGVFTFYGRSAPTSLVVLSFEDRDGEENGGEFVNLSMGILVNEKTPGIAGDNFKGTYYAGGVEVVMMKKKDQMNPDSGLIPLSSL